jgi:hypothetical protein
LTGNLNLGIVWLAESLGTIGVGTLYWVSIHKSGLRVVMKWLTTCTSTTAFVKATIGQYHFLPSAKEYILLECRCFVKRVARKEWIIRNFTKCNTKETYSGIKEMSALEPLPGLVGLTSVISTRVQWSPLKPQPPVCK